MHGIASGPIADACGCMVKNREGVALGGMAEGEYVSERGYMHPVPYMILFQLIFCIMVIPIHFCVECFYSNLFPYFQ